MEFRFIYEGDIRSLSVCIESKDIAFRDSIRELCQETLRFFNTLVPSVPVERFFIDFSEVQFISRAAMDEYVAAKERLAKYAPVTDTNMNVSLSLMLKVVSRTHSQKSGNDR